MEETIGMERAMLFCRKAASRYHSITQWAMRKWAVNAKVDLGNAATNKCMYLCSYV